MKTSRLFAIALSSAFAFSGLQAVSCDENGNCYTDPVGYITLKINGADAPGQKKITLAGLGLFNPVEFQGTLSGKSGKTLTVSGANFAANEFAPYDNDPSKPKYFVEFIDGDYAGLMADIESHTEDEITLTVDLGTLVQGDETIRIRKHHTLASVFGSDNSAGLKEGPTPSTADGLMIFDSTGQVATSYFYSSIFNRWAPVSAITTSADTQVIYPEQGIFITRTQTTPVDIKLVGSVNTSDALLPVDSGSSVISNIYPVNVSLGESGLYTGDEQTGVKAGPTPGTADQVTIFDENGLSAAYFYNSTGGFWAPASQLSTNANDVEIKAGTAVVIKRSGSSFNWKREFAEN